jgi:hypothetical protein
MKIITYIIGVLCVLTILSPKVAVSEDLPKKTPAEKKAEAVTLAIMQVETGGKCNLEGGSGERGCMQFLDSTWRGYAKKYMGTTTLPMTKENEILLLTKVNKAHILNGRTIEQVALIHNSGQYKQHRKGVNKFGVPYDTRTYTSKVLREYEKLI